MPQSLYLRTVAADSIKYFRDIRTLLRSLKIPAPRNPHFQIHRFEDAPDTQLNETMIFRSNTYVVALITEGEAYYKIGLHDYEMTAGSLYFLGPKHLRYYRREKKWRGFVCIFTDEFTTKSKLKNHYADYPFYRLDTSQKIQLDGEEQRQVEGLLNTLLSSFEQNKMDHCWHYLHILLSEADNLHQKMHQAAPASKESQLVVKFNELLEAHLYDIVSSQARHQYGVSDFAEKLAVNPNYLSQVLKQHTGETAGQLIRGRLITEAKSMLMSTEMSASQVAYALLYKDTSYFSKVFKSEVDATPREFQERYALK
ncbi:MAG: helix-turn-helix transcriptional regulator [Bacteroidota bacterium]